MDILTIIIGYLFIYLGSDIIRNEEGKVTFMSRGKITSTEWILHVLLITIGGTILINV